ncbi:hypothetical protein F2Q70_00014256 [Brassica cretica]|uniref:Uncharacterized protein n=1 Tax=Brassica cretica TaxID=69181 RepID=A0A8S9HVS9_BRACR|nr:hypothetical protein F2Q70_00014256 [Brassica cretica]
MDSVELNNSNPSSHLLDQPLPPPSSETVASSKDDNSASLAPDQIPAPEATNGSSNGDKNQSEDTTTRRKRRSRWDPPPSESVNNTSAEGGGGDSGTGTRKRKSRWADDEPKPTIQLPDFVKEFGGGIEFDPEIQVLNSRLLDISRLLQSGMALDDRPEGQRSPSPEPVSLS